MLLSLAATSGHHPDLKAGESSGVDFKRELRLPSDIGAELTGLGKSRYNVTVVVGAVVSWLQGCIRRCIQSEYSCFCSPSGVDPS